MAHIARRTMDWMARQFTIALYLFDAPFRDGSPIMQCYDILDTWE